MDNETITQVGHAVKSVLDRWEGLTPEAIAEEAKALHWPLSGGRNESVRPFKAILEVAVSSATGLAAFEIHFKRGKPSDAREIFGPLQTVDGLWTWGPGGGAKQICSFPIPESLRDCIERAICGEYR